MTLAGEVTSFPLPSGKPRGAIIKGPAGQLWFTDTSPQGISHMTTDGVITSVPLTDADAAPESMVLAADGNVWGTCFYKDLIVKVTPQGALTKYKTSEAPDAGVNGIASDGAGNLWFGLNYRAKVGRITLQGVSTAFDFADENNRIWQLRADTAGTVWFLNGSKVGKVTAQNKPEDVTGGILTAPESLTTGSNGNMWAWDARKIVRITADGPIAKTDAPTSVNVNAMILGPDQNLWFADRIAHTIGRFDVSQVP